MLSASDAFVAVEFARSSMRSAIAEMRRVAASCGAGIAAMVATASTAGSPSRTGPTSAAAR